MRQQVGIVNGIGDEIGNGNRNVCVMVCVCDGVCVMVCVWRVWMVGRSACALAVARTVSIW